MKIFILLLKTESFERRFAEEIECSPFQDFESILNFLTIKNDSDRDFIILELTEFMDKCNNLEIDIHKYWMSYVKTDK